MAEDLSLPVVEDGCIVGSMYTSMSGIGNYAGWYVHFVPEEGTKERKRYDECDDLTKWCDSELVKLPHSHFGGEPTSEELLETLYEYTFEQELSVCKRCQTKVPRGTLETDGGYVACVCGECKGTCTDCGANNWESLGRKRAHSTTSPPRWKCTECGHVKKGITTG